MNAQKELRMDVSILGATIDVIHNPNESTSHSHHPRCYTQGSLAPHPAHLTPHANLTTHTTINTPNPLANLLSGNLTYQKHTTALNPNAFTLLAQGQAPDILWIGCADSRIPETTVCHCQPGEIFVDRNIANTVHADDLNTASVVEYAVVYLRVSKVVVCGHTKCGGVGAAMGNGELGGTLDRWLGPVRELRRKNEVELESLQDDDARAARVAELNVEQSLEVLKQHPAIKRAIVERGLSLHGLIYDISAGQLKILEEAGGRKTNGH